MENERKVIELKLEEVLPNRFQPRIIFDEDSIMELAESIKEHGVIQPIVVRRIGDKYEIIAGERRYKASVIAGKQTIPAIITELNDKDSVEIALIENVQRENLTPIEEAISYKKILDMGYLNQEKLAEKLGKTQSTVANKLRLLNLDEDVQEALLQDKISERHARSLLKLKDRMKQRLMLDRIIKERLTVRKADEEIDKMNQENNGVNNINYNMPINPIINDTVEPVIDPVPTMINDPIMAPGFVDVDRIAAEATPIREEKPLANVDDLLRPTPVVVPSMPTLIVPPVIESTTSGDDEGDQGLRPGKFFNILGDQEVQTDTPPSSMPTPFPSFEQPTPIFPTNPEPSPFVNPTVVSEPIIVPEPVSIPNIPTAPTVTPFYGDIPETPTVPEDDDIEMISIPSDMEIEDVPVLPTSPIAPAFNEPIYSASEPIRSVEPTVIPYYDPEEPITINTPITSPIISTSNIPNDMKSVVNRVRACADEIEAMGFEIDLDEFDLENMYQVIFKIEKK